MGGTKDGTSRRRRGIGSRRRRRCRGVRRPRHVVVPDREVRPGQGRPDRRRGSDPAEGPDPRGEGREAPAASARPRTRPAPSATSSRTSSAASSQRDEQIDQRADMLEGRDRKLIDRERELEQAREELARPTQEQVVALERVSGLVRGGRQGRAPRGGPRGSRARRRQARPSRSSGAPARRPRRRRARSSSRRCSASPPTTPRSTPSSVVHLPSDEMKGRIIGREGRNIRALEQATGVDLIIDDTPETVVLSGFDPVRREVARLPLTKLIADGRIHPGRIEEVVDKARAEVDLVIRQAGEQAAYDAGVPGLPPEIDQAPRPAQVPHQLRPERAQPRRSRRAASRRSSPPSSAPTSRSPRWAACSTTSARPSTTRSRAPTRPSVPRSPSATTCRCKVVNGIAAHHQEVEYACVESPIVQVADAISASRPGARGESMDTYVKRLEDLQAIAESFAGRRALVRRPGRARGPDPRPARGDRRPDRQPAGPRHRQARSRSS